MSIMGCYPDKRAIENELGGKWELFFEETRDESGNVGLEWDKDYDNTPLNLNGVYVRITKPAGSNTAHSMDVAINGNHIQTSYTATTYVRLISSKNIIHNNLLTSDMYVNSNNITALLTQPHLFNEVFNVDSITNFTVSYPNADVGTTIEVYVLRGV